MNQSKVRSQGTVPFSWEKKPGVCKLTSQEQEGSEEDHFLQKLQPPSCPPESYRISIHDTKIPPPPCAFHPLSTTSSRRGLKKSDEPFLAAYKACTKSTSKGELAKKDGGSGLNKGMFNFSCKRSCSVRNDKLGFLSFLSREADQVERCENNENC